MKHKLAKALAAVVAVICAVSGMVACSGGGDVTVKLVDSSAERVVLRVEKTDGKANAFDMLEYLEDKGQLTVTSEDSAYGAFITAINGVANRVDESTGSTMAGWYAAHGIYVPEGTYVADGQQALPFCRESEPRVLHSPYCS